MRELNFNAKKNHGVSGAPACFLRKKLGQVAGRIVCFFQRHVIPLPRFLKAGATPSPIFTKAREMGKGQASYLNGWFLTAPQR